MPAKKFEIKEVVSFGWNAVWKNVWFWISLVLISGVISWLRDSISGNLYTDSAKTIIEVIFFFITAYITLGITRITLNYVDKKRTEYSDLVSSAKVYFNFLLATIIYTLIVMAGIILLVVPGVVWAVQYSMYPYLIIEKGYDPIQALRKSLEMTRGERVHIFALWLCLIGIVIVGALALVVGLVIAIPITWLAGAYVYRRLAHKAHAKVHAKVKASA